MLQTFFKVIFPKTFQLKQKKTAIHINYYVQKQPRQCVWYFNVESFKLVIGLQQWIKSAHGSRYGNIVPMETKYCNNVPNIGSIGSLLVSDVVYIYFLILKIRKIKR